MDLSFFQSLLLSSQAPWLPEAAIQRWGLHAAWSLVLGSLTFLLCTKFNFRWRAWVVTAIAAWSLWQGPESPSYWLGLAFQSPSLMSVALCLIWAMQSRQITPLKAQSTDSKLWPSMVLASAGILLGWVLLGDMLAWWSVSIYAWGFSTLALALACALAFFLWCVSGARIVGKTFTLGFTLVLLMFVLTRLPSGNLWDALLDPGLWVVLQVGGLLTLIRHRFQLRRESQATRA